MNYLKKILFDLFVNKLNSNDFIVLKHVELSDVLDLITKLHPQKIHFNLIRFGSDGDGGYLIPDDLEGIEACFSPGVDVESSFELDCYKKGMKLFLADYSVNFPKISNNNVKFDFQKKFIGSSNNGNYFTLDTWVFTSQIEKTSDLLLQMDIEGAEYETLINISPDLLNRFRIIVIEFHDLNKLWNPEFFKIASVVFNKILNNHYCIHIHPNNCYPIYEFKGVQIPPIMEFTFIRKDRAELTDGSNSFPHYLDRDNTSNFPVILPEIWYS